MAAKKCLICNQPFSGRRDAKTCSPRCRKRLQLIRIELHGPVRLGTVVREKVAAVQVPPAPALSQATERPAKKRRRTRGTWLAGLILGVAGVLGILFSMGSPRAAAVSANNTLNFQARLLNAAGAVVADGSYNIDFKIYNSSSGSGTVGTCSGSCLWEETWTNAGGHGISVVNGYFSVQLGSITAFPSTINWDQPLWLTMNITTNGTQVSAPISTDWNGELQNGGSDIPLTGVPLAFQANQLSAVLGGNQQNLQFDSGGTWGQNTVIKLPDPGAGTAVICYENASACGFAPGSSSSYIQNSASGPQSANFNIQSSSSSSITAAISGASSQSVDILDVKANGVSNPLFSIGDTGNATFRVATGHDSTTAFQVQNAGGAQLLNVDSTNGGNITLLGNNSGALGTWQTNPNSMLAGRNAFGYAYANGYIYALGGRDSSSTTQPNTYYAKLNANGSVSTWTATTSLPIASSNGLRCMGTAVANGYLYAIDGRGNSGTYFNTVYRARLNPDGSLGNWLLDPNTTPVALCFPNAVALNGYMYLMGGQISGTGASQSAVYYAKLNGDGTTTPWRPTASMPYNIDSAQAVTANGQIYVIGGATSGTKEDYVIHAKPAADGTISSWTDQTGTNPLPANLDNAMSAVTNGYLYILGGPSNAPTKNFYYASLNSNSSGDVGSWTTVSSALPDSISYGAGVGANGYVYIYGGTDTGLAGGNTTSVYYAQASKLNIGGSIDLIGVSGSGDLTNSSGGGSLTAGDTHVVGNLDVHGNSNLEGSLSVNNGLNVSGGALVRATASASNIFNIQNAGGSNVLAITTINLIGNGNFENGVTGDYPEGWVVKGGSTLSVSNNRAQFGSNAMLMTVSASGDGATYNVPLQPSTQYTLSFYIGTSSGTNTIDFGDQETGSDNNCSSGISVAFAFARKTCTFTTGSTISGTPNIYIKLDATGSAGSLYIDGVQLEVAAAASTYRSGDLTVSGLATFSNVSNSAATLQVQNASGNDVLTVDTSDNSAQGQIVLGSPSHNGGTIVFDNSAGAGTATITLAGNPSTNYTYQLPTGTVSSNQCLQSGTVSSGNVPLVFGSCSGGSTPTLQAVYDASTSAPQITLDSSPGAGGLVIQDASSPLGTNLFTVQNNGGTSKYLGVSSSGISITGTVTSSSDINTTSGGIQTNSTARIDNSGNLTHIGNFTASAGTTFLTTGSNGFTFKPGTDNATAFQIQNAGASDTLLAANTSNLSINITGKENITNDGTANTFPSNGVLDNFNRASLGTNWTTPGVSGNNSIVTIGSTQAGESSSGTGSAYWNVSKYGPDTEVYVDVPTLPTSGDTVAIGYRIANPLNTGSGANSYLLFVKPSTNTWTLVAEPAATVVCTFSTTTPLLAGDSIGAMAVGTTQSAWRKTGGTWSQVGSNCTDSTFTTPGYTGVFVFDTTTRLDNFGGGSINDTLTSSNSSSTSNIAVFKSNNTAVETISNGGNVLFQPAVNSATAFQIDDAGGNSFLNVDTVSDILTLDTATAGGSINIGNTQAHGQNIDIGLTGGGNGANNSTVTIANNSNKSATNTITIGAPNNPTSSPNASSNNSVTIEGGFTGSGKTGGVFIGNSDNIHTIDIGAAGSTTVQTVAIGSTSSTSSVTIQGGTGTSLSLQSAAGGTIAVGSVSNNSLQVGTAATTGTIQIGGTGTTGQITIGQANGSNSNTISIGSNIGSGGTQTISIGASSTSSSTTATTIGSTIGGSTTTLQAGSGGLLLNPSGSSNTGVIVKPGSNSTTAFQIQNAAGASIATASTTTTTNLLSYPGFEVGSPPTGYTAVSPGSISANTTAANIYQGVQSLELTTTGSNGGVQTTSFTGTVAAGTYVVSFYVEPSSAMNANGLTITLNDGSNHTCTPAAQTLSTSGFIRVSCSATTSSNLSYLEIDQNDGTGRNIFIDAIQLQSGSTATAWQIGGLSLNGIVTSPVSLQNATDSTTEFQVQSSTGSQLFNVDSLDGSIVLGNSTNNLTLTAGTFEPVLNGNARHTLRIALAPEYPGVTFTGSGSNNQGTLDSDNMTSSPFYNFYRWTTTQGTNQTYDLWVRYMLPTNFSAFPSGEAININTCTTDTTNGTITLQLYDTSNTAVFAGSGTNVTPSSSSSTCATSSSGWQTITTGSITGGTYSANNFITLRIRLQAPTSGFTFVSNLYFDYLSKY